MRVGSTLVFLMPSLKSKREAKIVLSIFKKHGIALFFIILASANSYAAGLSLRLEQSKVRLSIPAGGSEGGIIKLYNQSNKEVDLKIYLEDWVYTKEQDGSKEFFPAGSTKNSCAQWIKFNPPEFSIPPYGISLVNYIVNVPKDVAGGYYAVMFFETTSKPSDLSPILEGKELRSGISLAIRLGSLFYIEVKDTIKPKIEVKNVNVFKLNKNLVLNVDFKNIGNLDITAGGTFHIMDKQNMVYARGEFNNAYTLPGDFAKLKSEWKESIPKGIYSLVITLDLGKAREEARLGRGPVITKEAQLEIGEDGEVIRVGELR